MQGRNPYSPYLPANNPSIFAKQKDDNLSKYLGMGGTVVGGIAGAYAGGNPASAMKGAQFGGAIGNSLGSLAESDNQAEHPQQSKYGQDTGDRGFLSGKGGAPTGNEQSVAKGMLAAQPAVGAVATKAGPWGALIMKGYSDVAKDLSEGGIGQHARRIAAASLIGPAVNFWDGWKK